MIPKSLETSERDQSLWKRSCLKFKENGNKFSELKLKYRIEHCECEQWSEPRPSSESASAGEFDGSVQMFKS